MSTVARPDTGGGVSLTGWMWTWITIGALVVVVVVGYLLGIISALNDIDDNLFTVTSDVQGAEGDVQPLPGHIADANDDLTQIDQALAPIPGQADQIISSLSSIEGTLTTVDSSLKDTSGSLVNTDSVLRNVLGLVQQINTVLIDAENPPDRLGTQNIHERVAVANSVLRPAQSDTSNILSQLVEVNEHLVSVCNNVNPGAC